MSEEYKVVRVSMPTYGYLMDHKTMNRKSVDMVIWHLIEAKSEAKAKIKELEAVIADLDYCA